MLLFMARRRRNQPDSSLPLPMLAVVGVLVGGGAGWVATMPAPERASLVADVGRAGGAGDGAVETRAAPVPALFRLQ